jgi:hypothetical protein
MNTRDRISKLQQALWKLRDAQDLVGDVLGGMDTVTRSIQHTQELVEVELDELANKMAENG